MGKLTRRLAITAAALLATAGLLAPSAAAQPTAFGSLLVANSPADDESVGEDDVAILLQVVEEPSTETSTVTWSASTVPSEPTLPPTSEVPSSSNAPSSSAAPSSSVAPSSAAPSSTTIIPTTIVPTTEAPSGLALPGNDGSVSAGGSLTVEAWGFHPGEQVTITLYSTPVILATLLADNAGRVATTVTIPSAAVVGDHTIVVAGLTSGLTISVPLKVTAGAAAGGLTTTAPAPTTSARPALSATGTTASALVPWSLGLLLVGAAALVIVRRRSGSGKADH